MINTRLDNFCRKLAHCHHCTPTMLVVLHSLIDIVCYYAPSVSPDQAYNLLPAKYFNHINGGIGAGTIAALGTVAPGSFNLSYIYAPQVHTNLSGNFMGFVGNASNNIGEFSCVHIHKDSFGFFQIINSKANLDKAMPGQSSSATPFALDLLTNTD
jgi:hypothetical protein